MGDSYDPYANRDVSNPITDMQTLAHLLKGCLGAGVLAIPLAIRYAGLWLGVILTFIVAIIVTYCVYLLVVSSQRLCKRLHIPSLHFDEVGEKAFEHGHPSTVKFAQLVKHSINWCLILDLFGCCTVYTIFVAKNVKQVVDFYTAVETWLSVRMYILILLPLLLIYLMVRSLDILAPLSMVSNLFIFIGLCITIYHTVIDLPDISERPFYSKNLHTYPMYFGIAIFALEGIGVVMPLENHMIHPQHLIQGPCILYIGFTCVCLLYTSIGFLGYWKYGYAIQGSITLNLDQTKLPCQIVKLLFSLAIFQTFGLQFYVPFNIIWRPYKIKYGNNSYLPEYCARWVIGLICIMIAFLVPNIGSVISLIGSVTLSFLGIIFPAMIDINTCYGDPKLKLSVARLILNILLILFGVFGFVSGSVESIENIIKDFDAF